MVDILPGLTPAFFAFAIVLGGVAGFLAGLLGVGGGLVLVPGLYFGLTWLGFESPYLMHLAVGTSLAIIIPTGFSSARAHFRHGAVRIDLVRRIGPGIVLGVVMGTVIAGLLSGDGLKLVFAMAMAALAVLMMFDTGRFALAADVPGPPWSTLAGAGIGTLSALMGIGGATISVPYMTFCRVPMRQAVGTASALGLVIAIPAVVGFVLIGHGVTSLPPFSLGLVSLPALGMIAPAGMLAAPWGVRAAHCMPVAALRRIFAGFLVLVALRMLYDVLRHG